MANFLVAVIACTFFVTTKSEPGFTTNADFDQAALNPPQPITRPAVVATNTERNAETSTPPMFDSIMLTLEERLDATMNKPLMLGDRERILESTREGLNRCIETFRSTNVHGMYRICVDKQVQSALRKARVLELRAFNPVGWSMPPKPEPEVTFSMPWALEQRKLRKDLVPGYF